MTDMTFQNYINKNEELIRSSLSSADRADRVIAVLDEHLGRMLICYNEDCCDGQLRKTAAALISAVRSCLGFTDAAGEVQIWERRAGTGHASENSTDKKPAKTTLKHILAFWLPLIFGLLLLTGSVFQMTGSVKDLTHLPLSVLFLAAGGALLFLAGRNFGPSGAVRNSPALITQMTYDSTRIIQQMKRVAMVLDHLLEDPSLAGSCAEDEKEAAGKGSGSGMAGSGDRFEKAGRISGQTDMISLFSSLLEAAWSKDGEYALDELGQLPYFLHRRGIELEQDPQSHRDWFEYVPASESGTLRPAMYDAQSGDLLKKGLAGICS